MKAGSSGAVAAKSAGAWPREGGDLGRAEHRGAGSGRQRQAGAERRSAPGARSARMAATSGAVSWEESGTGNGAERVGGEEQDGEVRAVAEPEREPVAAAEAARRRGRRRWRARRRRSRRSCGGAATAPGAARTSSAACPGSRGGGEGVRGHVERRRAGRRTGRRRRGRARASTDHGASRRSGPARWPGTRRGACAKRTRRRSARQFADAGVQAGEGHREHAAVEERGDHRDRRGVVPVLLGDRVDPDRARPGLAQRGAARPRRTRRSSARWRRPGWVIS